MPSLLLPAPAPPAPACLPAAACKAWPASRIPPAFCILCILLEHHRVNIGGADYGPNRILQQAAAGPARLFSPAYILDWIGTFLTHSLYSAVSSGVTTGGSSIILQHCLALPPCPTCMVPAACNACLLPARLGLDHIPAAFCIPPPTLLALYYILAKIPICSFPGSLVE